MLLLQRIEILNIAHATSHFTVLSAVVGKMKIKNLKHLSNETQQWCGWKWMMITFPRCQTFPRVDSKSSLKRFTELKNTPAVRQITRVCILLAVYLSAEGPETISECSSCNFIYQRFYGKCIEVVRWVHANQQPCHCGVPACRYRQAKPGHMFDPNNASESINPQYFNIMLN